MFKMKNSFTYLITLLFLFSCQKEMPVANNLIGEWVYEDFIIKNYDRGELDIPYIHDYDWGFKPGFNFINEKELEFKQGFYKTDSGNNYFLGTKTEYKLQNDSLLIHIPAENKWTSFKIRSLTKNKLEIQIYENLYEIYSKYEYTNNPNENYDEIIVSTSGCFGTCPIQSISIRKTGEVLYYGVDYNTINGLYRSEISNEDYYKIQESFKKANIDKLEKSYNAMWTDDQTISVSFIKNGKIYKTVEDYGRMSPPQFIWAYRDVSYLYQSLKLDKVSIDFNPEIYRYMDFEDQTHEYLMSESESFFLIRELIEKGKITDQEFETRYSTDYYSEHNRYEIFTDGRFFKIEEENGFVTYDLGYNFFERNKIERE